MGTTHSSESTALVDYLKSTRTISAQQVAKNEASHDQFPVDAASASYVSDAPTYSVHTTDY
jgi:hypothetical protein